MQNVGPYQSKYGLEHHGIRQASTVYWNLAIPALYEQVVRREEGYLAQMGPLVVRTGEHTGRSAKDKFIVKEPGSQDEIWWGKVNRPIAPEQFERLHQKMLDYIEKRDLFVFDGYAGADPAYRMTVRIISEYAWHSLFAANMFIQESDPAKLVELEPDFTIIAMPGMRADPEADGTNSSTFILVSFDRRLVLIGGTEYSGEIKKSIFTAMNYYLPQHGVVAMHCSANYGRHKDDVALFFGLSGTGKTTLSTNPDRTLVGDDEHGWSDDGIFNFEGGCYAKTIRIDPDSEPQIYATTRRFGTILENVVIDDHSRRVDLDADAFTENTRASYPISHLQNVDLSGVAGHPKYILFLTADAFGVLPPISKLTRAQAMYYFLSGYTAKVAGTERGVTEPRPEFSACFGAPFMPLHPGRYADLLGQRIDQHGTQVWLLNTGWTGGPYGEGRRIKLPYTRRMVAALLAGELEGVETWTEPMFGLAVPVHVEGVPDEILRPRETWEDPAAYDEQARKLVNMFVENFKQFEDGVSEEIKEAGPQLEPAR